MLKPSRQVPPHRSRAAFTLVELLVVVAIIGGLLALAGPAMRGLSGAGTVNKALSDVSQMLEFARTFAMANSTYVRVGFTQLPAGTARPTAATAVVMIYSASGAVGSDADLASTTKWPLLYKPQVLDGIVMNDDLDATSPVTSSDATPAGKNTAADSTRFAVFTRAVPGANNASLSFRSIVQFSSSGEVRVVSDQPSHYIKLSFDQSVVQKVNPFIVRLSGINGSMALLRKEDGI